MECKICHYISDARCPYLSIDGMHLTCPICTGPVNPVTGCLNHPFQAEYREEIAPPKDIIEPYVIVKEPTVVKPPEAPRKKKRFK
jgi:hypothetical protein